MVGILCVLTGLLTCSCELFFGYARLIYAGGSAEFFFHHWQGTADT